MKLYFDGKESKKLNVRRDSKKLSVVDSVCNGCGHDRFFRYETGRMKCCRCGDITWE